jgi:hypothetical protein
MTDHDQPGDEALLSDPRWPEAVCLFNAKAWYDSHDAFEELWQETIGPDRPLLQAIVQIAVAHVHLERGNNRGATVLLGEALGRLVPLGDQALGLDLTALRTCVAARLQALQSGIEPDHLPVPLLIPG